VWAAKKSGVQRWEVISQAVALAPFSQNSKGSGLAPGATDALEAVHLVLAAQDQGATGQHARPAQDLA
jgi:hypothetical protein